VSPPPPEAPGRNRAARRHAWRGGAGFLHRRRDRRAGLRCSEYAPVPDARRRDRVPAGRGGRRDAHPSGPDDVRRGGSRGAPAALRRKLPSRGVAQVGRRRLSQRGVVRSVACRAQDRKRCRSLASDGGGDQALVGVPAAERQSARGCGRLAFESVLGAWDPAGSGFGGATDETKA